MSLYIYIPFSTPYLFGGDAASIAIEMTLSHVRSCRYNVRGPLVFWRYVRYVCVFVKTYGDTELLRTGP